MSNSKGTVKEFTGKHMLIIMISMFAVIIGVNLTMAVLASKTWTGLVVKNSYVESQKFNKYLADADKQAALGWQTRIETGSSSIAVIFSDKEGKAINDLDVTAVFQRPAHENEDRVVKLNLISDGKYSHNSKLTVGRWNVKLVARGLNKKLYRQNYEIVIK